MKKTTIDAKLLPNVWVTWDSSKGTFYLNCKTGEKQTECPECFTKRYDPYNILVSNSSKPRFAYAKYHEDMERLELAEVTIDTTRKEEAHEWKYNGNKYFLGKDKVVVDEEENVCIDNFYMSRYHVGYNFANFLGMFYRLRNANTYVVEEFKKFLGSDTYLVGSGRLVEVKWGWHIQEWYKKKQKMRGAGKQQKLTDKLVAIPLSDASDFTECYPVLEENDVYYKTYVTGIIYFERVDDNWSVLRIFNRSRDNTNMYEKERVYMHDDGANRIVTPSANGWVPAKQSNDWGNYAFVNKNEAKQQCKRLKYIIPLIEDDYSSKIKQRLISILRFPELEQMINLGYKNEAKKLAGSSTPKADIKNMFGGYYNEKETTLLRKIGLTKHQLDKYMQMYKADGSYYGRTSKALMEMRNFFGDSFIHLDNATFDKYITAFSEMCDWNGFIFRNIERLSLDFHKFIRNIVRLGEKHSNIYNVAKDTMNRYLALNPGTQPEINWYFEDYSDAVRMHNAIDALKREQDSERRAMWNMAEAERRKKEDEKRIKVDEKRKCYEYEDDTYVIRLPKDSNEIVREGSWQRICIGGYTSNHALGHTNLFFIRKKNEPDVPFYAIEMNNYKEIVQIHGYCNAWLGVHPEAIPTVVRWLRKNGIKCDEKILTCTARGYGATNHYVQMPIVE